MNISEIEEKEFFPGLHGRLIHGKNITWAFWNVEKGAIVPLHSHIHEQIMYVIEGKFQLIVDGVNKIFDKGDYKVGEFVNVLITNCTSATLIGKAVNYSKN